jgi:hypothetical protein
LIERLLHRLTAHLPCRCIDGENGEPYLERYYLLGAFGWHAYLHRFADSDPDRGLHDHPWNRAVSLVLTGGYDELRPAGADLARAAVRAVRPWRLNFLRGEDFHRVVLRSGAPAWTLFLHGPRVKGWGFMQQGEYRVMAKDGSDFRHRDWWKQAPPGHAMRAAREAAPRQPDSESRPLGAPCPPPPAWGVSRNRRPADKGSPANARQGSRAGRVGVGGDGRGDCDCHASGGRGRHDR